MSQKVIIKCQRPKKSARFKRPLGVNVGSLTFESVRPLLGPRWTIEGEDSERYEKILKEVGAAAQPIDFIDWLLVKDIVDLTWEIQRGPAASAIILSADDRERTRIAERHSDKAHRRVGR